MSTTVEETSSSSNLTTTTAATTITTTTAATSQKDGGTTTDRSSSSTESRRKPEYDIGAIIDGKWKVLSELGRGGCGVVYCVEKCDKGDDPKHPKAALKAEYILKHYSETLAAEANILKKLQWSHHVCQLYACGRISNDINIVCMSLAGPSLSYLRRNSPHQRMSFSTGLRIAFHCLNAIEDLHCIGYLHRDVKASNFAVGYYASEARSIRILDFGFARSYLSWNSTKTYLQHRKPRDRAPFLGTDRYCSLNVHKRIEQGRRDDCWSWLFMLVELIYGKLPWRDEKPKKICEVKENSLPTLFRHGPVELYSALDHLEALKLESRPNYDHLRDIITKICKDRGYYSADPYDWEVGGEHYQTFEKLKNQSPSKPAAGARKSISLEPEKFEEVDEESFVEILDRQASPPAEKLTTDDPAKKLHQMSIKEQENDEIYEDAKDDTKRN